MDQLVTERDALQTFNQQRRAPARGRAWSG